jgi:hypothetical protein
MSIESDSALTDESGAETAAGRPEVSLEELGRLADGLREQAASVRSHYEEVARTLDSIGDAEAEAVVPERTHSPGEGRAPAEEPEDRFETARLMALNMAVLGESRDDAAARLREDFGLANADEVVDEVYRDADGGAAFAPAPRRRRFGRRR